MQRAPFDFSTISDAYKDKNLPTVLIILKRVGQASLILMVLGFAIIQANGGQREGTLLLDIASQVSLYGLAVGLLSLMIVGAYGIGFKKTFVKVFLYMFLPAIIITAIVVVIFVLPRQ